jgi:hypothetical protein
VNVRNDRVKKLLDNGELGQLWVSALECKDAALALETRNGELPEPQRARVSSAVKALVLAAWRIDRYGDLGNRQVLVDTYKTFAAAVADINGAYESSRR